MSSDRGSLAMSHTLSPPKPLMPQPNRTNSAQPHRVTPGPPTDTPVSFSSRLRAWQLPERDALPFEDLDVCGESSTLEHLARFRRQMSRRDPTPGAAVPNPSRVTVVRSTSFVALGLGHGEHRDHPAVLHRGGERAARLAPSREGSSDRPTGGRYRRRLCLGKLCRPIERPHLNV